MSMSLYGPHEQQHADLQPSASSVTSSPALTAPTRTTSTPVEQNRLVTVNGGGRKRRDQRRHRRRSTPSVVRSPVTVNGEGDNDTLNLGGGWLDSIAGLVTFNGGGGSGIGNRMILNDATSFIPYEY